MRHGFEAWNRPDAGKAEEWARIRAMRSSVLKLRAYHPTEVVDTALKLNPNMRFLLRRSHDGTVDPLGQVQEAQRLINYIQARGAWVAYIADNEPNHPDRSYADPDAYAKRLARVLAAFRATYSTLPLVSPPMIVMCETERWLAAIEPVCQAYEVEYRGAHAYWQFGNYSEIGWGKSIDAYQTICPGACWIVDEVGDATPMRSPGDKAVTTLAVLDWLQRRGDVEAATVFIAGGTEDWRAFWLPADECEMIGNAMAVETAEEGTTMTSGTVMTEQQKILAALDDMWGRTKDLDAYADEIALKTERIRAQIIAVKEAVGLNSPKA